MKIKKSYNFSNIKCLEKLQNINSILIKLASYFLILGLFPIHASQVVILDALEDHSGESYKKYLSHIPYSERTLITSTKWLTDGKNENLKTIFSSIATVEEYHLSAGVEVTILELHKNKPITAIITNAIEEFDIVRAASLREYLGLSGQNFESAQAFRNKVIMKDIVQKNGFKVPSYKATDSGLDLIKFIEENGYPVITKPRTGVGSIKTSVIKNENELQIFLRQNYNCHYYSNLMVESFVNGHVYQIDGLYQKGKVYAWPSKYVNSCLEMALEGKVLGSHLLSSENLLTPKLISYAKKLVKIFPLPEKMPFHLEVFVGESNQEIIFCEIASRVGGYVNNNWKEGFNIDLEQAFYDIQSGKEQDQIKNKIAAPHKIPGWLLFPACPNRIIEKMPIICPFDYCTKFETLMNVGDCTGEGLGICNNVAKCSLLSNSEEDFMLKSSEFISWYQGNLSYAEAKHDK